uniref:TRAF3-interacting protein 1 n=1 Tax=Mucochytrium quahogii TaxID=96639 RepID=A0A7S2RW11_9STRA|mmetsp:Transcript_20874/g.45584  ORF Transcript_20874/g.45584 Transcript_20874/m.45584 type:complete len:396 (+) Transcript_20874:44-1231(+)
MEDIIQETKNVIGSIIRKPKMSDKLLSRPPFRFLHDTIMAIDAKTNFVQELLEDDEKDSSNIKEKEAKIGFLKKIINFAGICNGEEVDVRANKIVAGAEAENTNVLMQVLGRVSQDTTIDFAAAASLAINGESPGNIPRVGGGEGKEADDDQADAAAKRAQEEEAAAEMERQREEEKRRKRKKEKERLQQQKEEEERRARQAEEQQRAAAEEETKSPGSPGGNAAQETKDSDGNIGGGDFDTSSVDGETATTTQLYDGLIRKPKLSDKLLGKPPFRFLHDIVSNVNASVSIVDGLFEGEELDARQCSTKELKLGYLEKLVSFVSICTGTTVQARPSRIVAGHEAEKNQYAFAKACIDCKEQWTRGNLSVRSCTTCFTRYNTIFFCKRSKCISSRG